ncbi:DNA replication complex GINS protein PSF1 [Pseudogymnoascus sp. 24MN13]|nr:DNA replication complex GINS protein PSF1 [Pseudogymnoascus sp. 24MN13]
MYGDLGNKLAQHAKRTQGLANLPPYQTETVRAVTREARELHKDIETITQSLNGSFTPSEAGYGLHLFVNHLFMRRNKRCLLAYHRVRTDKLEELVWSGEDILDAPVQQQKAQESYNSRIQSGNAAGGEVGNGESNKHNLSPEEEEYVRKYSELLSSYTGQWTDVDLAGSLEPPRDLFIDVRVLKDAGEIQTEYGSITLTKNSQFYVRQGDVERLIAQGYLQKLS